MPGIRSRLQSTFNEFVDWCRRKANPQNSAYVVEVRGSQGDEAVSKRIQIAVQNNIITYDGEKDEHCLKDCDLASVLDAYPSATRARQIVITHCPLISNIPVSVGRFINVTLVDFSSNGLQDLPWSLVYLSRLKNLNVSDNRITVLPPIVGHLSSLEKLNVSNNFLQFLPTSLLKLEYLKVLGVSGNYGLIAPPIDICKQGLDAIRTQLQKRKGRRNLWSHCKQYYTDCAEMPGAEVEVRTLLGICVGAVLRFNLDYLSQHHVPPPLKRHLHDSSRSQMEAVKVCKCSRCAKFFSSVAFFDGHDCQGM